MEELENKIEQWFMKRDDVREGSVGHLIRKGEAKELMAIISTYHHQKTEKMVEKLTEKRHVMAHIVGAKRVETPWVNFDEALAIITEEESKQLCPLHGTHELKEDK